MMNYAYAWGNIDSGKMPDEKAAKDIITKIEGFDWNVKSTWPQDDQGNTITPEEPPWHLYRKTIFDSRVAAAAETARLWKAGPQQVRVLTKEERKEKRTELTQKYGGLEDYMMGEMEPSEQLDYWKTFFTGGERTTESQDRSACRSARPWARNGTS